MASALAWLDNDDTEQQKMRQLIALFKDESTVDELGLGTIRDTIANALFPGTSVLQTRARYFLFTGWLVKHVARQGLSGDQAQARLRADEIKGIDSLLAGGEGTGVIGRQARSKLKSTPSAAFWAGMGRLGVRTWDLSIAGHLRAAAGQRELNDGDPEDRGHSVTDVGIDPHLPPRPDGLLTETSFELTEEEAGYLRDRIAESCSGTLFAWLALNGRPFESDYPWQHGQLAEFPEADRRLLDHGRRFHHAIYGAALLYNLMLAEKKNENERRDTYRDELASWREDIGAERVFDGWDRTDFWTTLLGLNPRIHPGTNAFVDQWLDLAQSGRELAQDTAAQQLIAQRERKLKGNRSRLNNTAALDAWTGGSGLGRLDYRWRIASSHLHDIYAGLGVR